MAMVMAWAASADRNQSGLHHHIRFQLRISPHLLQNLKCRPVLMMTTMMSTMPLKNSDIAVAVPVTSIIALVIAQCLSALVVHI